MGYTFTSADITALAHTTTTSDGVDVAEGTVVATGDVIVSEASAGYAFTVDGMGTVDICFVAGDGMGGEALAPFDLTEENTTATFTMDATDYDEFRNGMEVLTPDYTLTSTDLSNLTTGKATLEINGVTAVTGDGIYNGDTLVATSATGYSFYTDAETTTSINFYASDGMGSYSYLGFTLSDGNTVATLTFTGGPWDGLNVLTNEIIPDYIVTQDDLDYFTTGNATLKINGDLAILGSEIFAGDLLLANANSGYVFYPDDYDYESDTEASVYFTGADGTGSTIYQGFTLISDNMGATLTFVAGGYDAIIVRTIAVTEVTGTNNVYKIDSNTLSAVNNVRFVGVAPNVYDYGQFILSVLELPFTVDADLIISPESSIMLATYDTEVTANQVSTDEISVNLGSITVPATRGDLLDFKDTTSILHLPWVNSIILDNNYVIGETVSIQYDFDCYTGYATVNISSTKVGGVIHTVQVDIGINVPYAQEVYQPSAGNLNISVGGDNGIKIPYIEIMRNDPMLPDGFFTGPIIDEDLLSSASGFVKVEQVDLQVDASYSEKNIIVSMLQSGIIIR